jgi:hypothetical protein
VAKVVALCSGEGATEDFLTEENEGKEETHLKSILAKI